jgi:hypothetical protein
MAGKGREALAAAAADARSAALARMRVQGTDYVPPIFVGGPVRDKVCIVGFAGSTRDQFPKDDPTMEIWGMNRLFDVPGVALQHFTRWFQIHPRRWWDTEKRQKEVAWLRNLKIPVYLHEHYDDIPTSMAFPRADVEAAFNRYLPSIPGSDAIRNDGRPYHTTSVTWMIALALLEGFKEIHIYGVDMVTDEEYGYQRPACEFWLGLAAGLGVKTVIPADSALCTMEWLYGWELPQDREGVINATVLEQRKIGLSKEMENAKAAANQLGGAINEINLELSALKHARRGGKTFAKACAEMAGKATPKVATKPQTGSVPVADEEPALRAGVKG